VLERALLLACGSAAAAAAPAAAAAAAALTGGLCGGVEAALQALGFVFFCRLAVRMPLNISFTSLLALAHAIAPLARAKMLSPHKWPRTRNQLLHANSVRQKMHVHIKVE
jgi:hypothetical protein